MIVDTDTELSADEEIRVRELGERADLLKSLVEAWNNGIKTVNVPAIAREMKAICRELDSICPPDAEELEIREAIDLGVVEVWERNDRRYPPSLHARAKTLVAKGDMLAAVVGASEHIRVPFLERRIAELSKNSRALELILDEFDRVSPPSAKERAMCAAEAEEDAWRREMQDVAAAASKRMALFDYLLKDVRVDDHYRRAAEHAALIKTRRGTRGFERRPPIVQFFHPDGEARGRFKFATPDRIHISTGLNDLDLVEVVAHETQHYLDHCEHPGMDVSECKAEQAAWSFVRSYTREFGEGSLNDGWRSCA